MGTNRGFIGNYSQLTVCENNQIQLYLSNPPSSSHGYRILNTWQLIFLAHHTFSKWFHSHSISGPKEMNKKLLLFLSCLLGTLIFNLQVAPTFASPGYEDFDTYTTTGSVTTDGVRLNATLTRNQDTYAVKDYGAGTFDDFQHELDIFHNSSTGFTSEFGNFWMLANITDDEKGIRDASSQTFLAVDVYTSDGGFNWRLRLKYWNDVGLIQDAFTGYGINIMYYLRVNRTGTTANCWIYSDSGRVTLLDTLTVTCTTDAYRYVYGCNSYNDGTARNIQVMVENLDLTITVDNLSPHFHLAGLNTTIHDTTIQFTVNISDSVELDFLVLEWNNSGSYINHTLTLSGIEQQALMNLTLNSTSGVTVYYRFLCNDTSNNWNSTIQMFLVTNTLPVVGLSSAQLFVGLAVIMGSIVFVGFLAFRKK